MSIEKGRGSRIELNMKRVKGREETSKGNQGIAISKIGGEMMRYPRRQVKTVCQGRKCFQ